MIKNGNDIIKKRQKTKELILKIKHNKYMNDDKKLSDTNDSPLKAKTRVSECNYINMPSNSAMNYSKMLKNSME